MPLRGWLAARSVPNSIGFQPPPSGAGLAAGSHHYMPAPYVPAPEDQALTEHQAGAAPGGASRVTHEFAAKWLSTLLTGPASTGWPASTTVVCIVLIVLVVLTVIAIIWDWWRSGRALCVPVPRRYRARASQEAAWRQRCGDELAKVNRLLRLLCEAFDFNPDDRFQFGPDDRVMDIYRACYPRWKFWQWADSMEIESLMMDLEAQFGLDVDQWHPDISLGELYERLSQPRGP
jgi:hypothetical protein